MKRWKKVALMLGVVLGVSGIMVPSASAVDVFQQCQANSDSTVCASQNDNAATMMGIIINTLLYIIGIIAVIMIVVGGIRYSLSGGNASQVKEAKDTILYSVIGLVVAIMAYAIVNFVLNWF
jgi:hypothetical protein